MNIGQPHLAGRLRTHPAVFDRRVRDLSVTLAAIVIPLAAGLGITVAYPSPNPFLLFGVLIGFVGVVTLLMSKRYEITLAVLMLYLGVADGPVKLEAASQIASGVRDILILAICVGMLMRMAVNHQSLSWPPLSGWVIAFVAFVLVGALNPLTLSILKSLGGFRQELEWVPFFFFGFMILRTKERIRRFFLILGVIALANGLVGAVQSRLTPAQLARWGPGYRELVFGGEGNGITGRTYSVEGVAHVRPPALGSDAGFGGGVGGLALPCIVALLAAVPLRRRWPVLILAAGAVLGIATAASRTSIVVAAIGVLSFVVLSFAARLKVSRALIGLVLTGFVMVGVGYALIAANGSSVFARQETLTSVERAEETGGNSKEQTLSEIPTDIEHQPFGYGLGVAGSVSGFGGHNHATFEGTRVTGGSVYSLLMKEVGLPGLLLWIGLTFNVIALAVTRLRRVVDTELRTYLVGLVAAYCAVTAQGFSGPTLAVTVGAFLWFVPGVISYWLAGPGRSAMTPEPGPDAVHQPAVTLQRPAVAL